MANILVVDDDEMICEALADLIRPMGHSVAYALNLKQGLRHILADPFDLVFLDIRLPDGNGLDVIPDILQAPCRPDIIIITGEGDPDGAELAIRSGCWDYIQKPLSAKGIILPLTRILEHRREKRAGKKTVALKRGRIIGNSPRLRTSLDLTARAAGTDTNVLISGETGTGKELFARAIHENSLRCTREFVVVDCTALPENLVETMLFGHEKGSFTGAVGSRSGLIAQAHGGTLFLDEVGELPMAIQGSFLRVLQERRFRPIGAGKEVSSDFRLIAATNRDLEQMVEAGTFRQDLLFRLRNLAMELPPLRERREDINDIALYYLSGFCKRYNLGTKGISAEFLEALHAYSWPGNVRELSGAMEQSVTSAGEENTLYPIHLPANIRSRLVRDSFAPPPRGSAPFSEEAPAKVFPDYKTLLSLTEKNYFKDLIRHTGGNIKEVCRISDLSRSQVYRLLKKHGITRKF